MALCTLPFVLGAYGLAPERMWTIACGSAALLGTIYVLLLRSRARLLRQPIEGFSNAQFGVLSSVGVFVIALLVAGACGAVPPKGTYLLGVFCFLVAVVSFFVRLVLMLDASIKNTE